MKMLRSALLATVLALSVPSPVFTASALEPATSPVTGSAEDFRNLRQEIDTLKRRLDALEKQRSRRESVVVDGAEKARLQAELQAIQDAYHREKSALWRQTHHKIREHRDEAVKALTEMQESYTRRSKLDEALAIREAIRNLHEAGRKVLPDPGTLSSLVGAASQVFFIRVTGAASGTVYGTDVYTSDSCLAAAAVHAGVLKVGESRIVKVTSLPTHQGFAGSTRNGVTSNSWSSYPGYRIEAVGDEDEDLLDCPSAARPTPSVRPGEEPEQNPIAQTEAPVRLVPPGAGGPSVEAQSSLPAEAREHIEGFNNVSAELRRTAREKAAQLARETIERITPIQDAHTRAARLDEAIAVREIIRKLSSNPGS